MNNPPSETAEQPPTTPIPVAPGELVRHIRELAAILDDFHLNLMLQWKRHGEAKENVPDSSIN